MRYCFLLIIILSLISACKNQEKTAKKELKSKSQYLSNLKKSDIDGLSISFFDRIYCTENYLRKIYTFTSKSADSVNVCEFNFEDSMICKTQPKELCLTILKDFESEINLSPKDCNISSDTIVHVKIMHHQKNKGEMFYCKKSLEGLGLISKHLTNPSN